VVTEKVALLEPCATLMLEGTVAVDVLLLDRATDAPPAGAAPVSVTVPRAALPPGTLDGETVIDERATLGGGVDEGGNTVRVADRATPP
jgi:hypothetical protein